MLLLTSVGIGAFTIVVWASAELDTYCDAARKFRTLYYCTSSTMYDHEWYHAKAFVVLYLCI